MKALAIAFVACCVVSSFGQSFQSEFDQVVSLCSQDKGGLDYLREHWIRKSIVAQPIFRSVCSSISTNWGQIASSMPFISTNDDNRLVFSKMIGYVETNAFLQVCSDFIDLATTNSGLCPPGFITDISLSAKTPLEYYIPLHHDESSISNLALRARALYPPNSSEYECWTDILSGEVASFLIDSGEFTPISMRQPRVDFTAFDIVTNAWWHGQVSNVVAIAHERLAVNTNDIPALVILTEVDMETMDFPAYSNHAGRAATLLSRATNSNLLQAAALFCADYSNTCEVISECTLSSAEMEAEKAKFGRPEKTMTMESVLKSLSDSGEFAR